MAIILVIQLIVKNGPITWPYYISNTNVRVFPVICAPRFVRFAITGSLPGSQCPQGMRGQVADRLMYKCLNKNWGKHQNFMVCVI